MTNSSALSDNLPPLDRTANLDLLAAIRDFDKSKIIRAGFGDELVNSYV